MIRHGVVAAIFAIVVTIASPSAACSIDYWTPARDKDALSASVREAVFVGDVVVEHVNRRPGDRPRWDVYYRVTNTIKGDIDSFVITSWFANDIEALSLCFVTTPPEVGDQHLSVILQGDLNNPDRYRLIHPRFVRDEDMALYRDTLIQTAVE